VRVVVCVKQIPDPESAPDPTLDSTWRIDTRAEILDDADRYGIELGLQFAEAAGGTVTMVSLGSATSDDGLRQGFAMGAEDAVLVREGPTSGADALATARALAAVIAEQGFDVVITGTASADGSAGVMTGMLGELLGVPAITEVTQADIADGTLTVHRQTAAGHDVVSCPLPAVLSVTAGAVEPRFPTIRGSMKAKRKQPVRREIADVLAGWPGMAALMPQVVALAPAEVKVGGRVIEDDGSAELAIVSVLQEQGVLR
jgi:electron transfer flavoprotein beta subunit